CHGCGQPCDGYYCESCTCPQCGMTLFNGICDNCIYGAGMPIICTACGSIYPDVNPPSPEISNEENFQAKGDLMKSIQTFLESFNCIPFEKKPQILFQTWETFFAIQCSQPEDSNELFQKLLKDLKELAEYDQSTSTDRPIFLNSDEGHSVQDKESPENPFNEITDNESDLEPEATTDTKLSSTKDIHPLAVQESPHDSDICQLIREECCIEVPKQHDQKMKDMMFDLVTICHIKQFLCIHDDVDDLIESAIDSKLLLINSIKFQRLDKQEQEVKNVEDDDESFEDIEYVDASVPDPEIVSVDEENVVQREEEEVDLEDISQVQDVVLREKLFSITRLISNIESLNDNSSFESDNSLLDNFLPEFETFCDNSEKTRSGNTTHANYSLPEYDSFALRLSPIMRGEEIAVVMNDKDKFDDDYQIFMFDKVFSLLSAESEDTIFDLGLSLRD
nr:hypothetical protein [Tanacetum cinerariifolium]